MGRRIASAERPASSGRVFKTESILDYLSQPALRTRIRRGLLKGEQLHALARCVHYGRLGRLDQRDFERQTGAASGLLLILAAIIYRQIRGDRSCFGRGGLGWPDDLNFELRVAPTFVLKYNILKDPFLSGPGHDRGRTGRRE